MFKNIFFACLLQLTLITITTAYAAEPADEELVAAEVIPASPEKEAPKQTTRTVTDTRPINDNHVDYRHCLDLKTNPEIIACRYKKK